MKQLKGLLALVSIGIIAIVLMIAYGFGQPQPTTPAIPVDRSATTIVNPGDNTFEIRFEDTYTATSGSILEIPIDVRGATSASGRGIAGYHITLSGLPSVVTNVTLEIDDDYWPVNTSGLSGGSASFYGQNANKVLTENRDDFFVLKLTMGTISQNTSFNIAVDLADNSVPSQSHSMSGTAGTKITVNSGSGGSSNFTFSLPSTVNASGSSFTIPIGISGASSSTQVDGVSLILGNLPSYISGCTVSTSRSGWTASGNMVSREYRVVARGESNPVNTSISNLLSIVCNTSGTITSSSITIRGEVSVVSPQATHTVTNGTLTLAPASTPIAPTTPGDSSSYSISGTISGDTKNSVTVSCGAYSAKSGSNGAFTLNGVPNGTTCTLIPQKNNYIFVPASRQITIQGANVTAQDFRSDDVKGDKGDDGDDDDDDDDKKSSGSKSNSSGNTVASRVAPKSGPAENIIIVSAVLIGIIGAVIFVGSKLKWFA